MIACPNCSSNLKYNIKLQKLSCDHCASTFSPYQFDEESGIKKSTIEVTVFACSQCGGELYTTDNEMAGFCSFCGSTTILESRIADEKRPDYIIPFQKTKEDCKEEYRKLMRKAFFVPKALKSPECIDGFRGIYMPYWIYDVKQQEKISLSGKRRTIDNDYIITSYYTFDGNLAAHYEGITYDGSSSFSDNISKKLIPYKLNSLREFTPTFLSGFYADAADLEVSVYEEDVKGFADLKTGEFVKSYYELDPYEIESSDESITEQLGTTITKEIQAMLPVWFMSYRNKDWVAYAAVNGQTGKVVADFPVDIKKYLLCAVFLALPFFLLLCVLDGVITILPSVLLEILLIVTMVVSLMHTAKLWKIVKREENLEDKGALIAQQREGKKIKKTKKKKLKLKRKKNKTQQWVTFILIFGCVLYVLLPVLAENVLPWLESLPYRQMLSSVTMVSAVFTIVTSLISLIRSRKLKLSGKLLTPFCYSISTVLAVVILNTSLATDVYYYVGIFLSCGAIVYTLVDLMRKYNVLATRKLPQLERRGGDGHG